MRGRYNVPRHIYCNVLKLRRESNVIFNASCDDRRIDILVIEQRSMMTRLIQEHNGCELLRDCGG